MPSLLTQVLERMFKVLCSIGTKKLEKKPHAGSALQGFEMKQSVEGEGVGY